MNNNYNTNMNQSFGYSQQDQSVGGQYQASYLGGSPPKGQKPPPAGILSSKTLAEENLKGFKLRNL